MFCIFAIFGVNFFVGQQYQFCRSTLEPFKDEKNQTVWPIDERASFLCSTDDMCSGSPNKLGAIDESAVAKCGNVYRDYGLDPVTVDSTRTLEVIQYDIVNFNNLINAFITVF